MNEKKIKALRREARITMSSSPNKDSSRKNGPDAYRKPMMTNGEKLGASLKQVKRAVRTAVREMGKKLPAWAVKQTGIKGLKGLFPIPT